MCGTPPLAKERRKWREDGTTRSTCAGGGNALTSLREGRRHAMSQLVGHRTWVVRATPSRKCYPPPILFKSYPSSSTSALVLRRASIRHRWRRRCLVILMVGGWSQLPRSRPRAVGLPYSWTVVLVCNPPLLVKEWRWRRWVE